MAAPIRVLVDDMMPGVEACLAQWRDAQGQAPSISLTRLAGRAMNATAVADAELLLVRSITHVDANLLAEASDLRFVGSATIGRDHLDLNALSARGLPWASAPGCNAQAVAEWVLATLLRQAAMVPAMSLAELRERRVGIIGMGQVGRRVAALLGALGLVVYGCDPLLTEASRATLPVSGWLDLDSLLASVDIVCVHTPLTTGGPAPTGQMLTRERLAQLKPDAWLVNAGRGDVITAEALLTPSASWRAFLDVLPNEPVPDPAVVARCQQVSPHIAGHSLEGKWRGTWQICAQAAEVFGYELLGDLADVMPAHRPDPLVWPTLADASKVAPYAVLMAQIVDCAGDDQRLRAVIAERPGQASAFDELRKHYASRREIAAYRIEQVPMHSSAHAVLTALGFSC